MGKDGENKFEIEAKVTIKWPKGLLRLFGEIIKRLIIDISDLARNIVRWIKGPWPWL
jgi:hypothetical protein